MQTQSIQKLTQPITKNVVVADRRTSVHMEPAMWDALTEVCRRERISMHSICTLISRNRGKLNLTAAIRIFLLSYFRSAATEDGHRIAGHGRSSLEALAAGSGLESPRYAADERH